MHEITTVSWFQMNVAITVLVVIIGIVGIVLFFRRGTIHQPSGFREIFGSRKGKEDYFAMTQPRDDLDRLSKRQIDRIVMEYVESAGQSSAFWQVVHLDKRAFPSLLRILANPANRKRPVGENVTMFHKSKVERALEILRNHDIPETLPHLRDLASDRDYHIRSAAASPLARYPSKATLDLIAALMSDPEQHVRSSVYIGISHAIREGRLDPEMSRSIADLLSKVVVKELEESCWVVHPASLWFELDPDGATARLTSPEVLDPSRAGSSNVIALLREKGIPIPNHILESLLAATHSADATRRLGGLRGELLKTMAAIAHPDAESRIFQALASPLPSNGGRAEIQSIIWEKEDAAEALCILMGIHDPMSRVFDLLEKAEKAGRALEGPVLNALIATELDLEVSNGGLDQYFFNGSGDRALMAATALLQIGALEHAEIARHAASLFGPEGPSPNREQRFHQREAMDERAVERLRALDNEWFMADPILRLRILTYCAANAEAFN